MAVLLFSPVVASAQNMTVILIRHAEKDVSATADKRDPELTEAGRARAAKLLIMPEVRTCKPDQIFSTGFKRTRLTVTPLAQDFDPVYRLMIQTYDFSSVEEFAKNLLSSGAKCAVVVGHSNTTPTLANFLLKTDTYKELPDSEYSKMWIIRIKGKKASEKVITY